ncbi:MAG: hypothetical protein ACREAQ_04395 [Nitrososphaera sp.]
MMAGKFAIVIAAVAAVMIFLLVVPDFDSDQPPSAESRLDLEYSRQHIVRTENGSLVAASAELLVIRDDGSATYSKINGTRIDERSFSVESEEMKRLRALIGMGFMQVPEHDYIQKEGLASFTKYKLVVKSDESSNAVSWVDAGSYEGVVPPLITNIGSQLDGIISGLA